MLKYLIIIAKLDLFPGGWWEVKRFGEIPPNVAIEVMPQCYITALDTGGIAIGSPRDEGTHMFNTIIIYISMSI